ncbi:MAG: hypothetical protein IIW19_02605, partial [Clostridia bacterium]|nr:hypothetical protein [Clostridia bacterium]
MFQQGQQIIYGGNGVCRIEEIVLRESALSEELTACTCGPVLRVATLREAELTLGTAAFLGLIEP